MPTLHRLQSLRTHVCPAASGSYQLSPEDLLGGSGFTDAVGLTEKLKAVQPATRRQELESILTELGLLENCRQLDEEGWTIVRDAMSPDLTCRLRARIMELTDDQLQKKRRSGLRFAQLGALLYHGRAFEEAAQSPKQMALAEYMVGAGYGVWQYLCSVRGEGTSGLPVHKDDGPGWREPANVFPEMVTSLFITDDFVEGAGATFVVPRSHLLRRRPRLRAAVTWTAAEIEEDTARIVRDAIPVIAPPGSVVMWDARTWHGSLPRRLPGERVVCSFVNTRVHFKSSEDYSRLPQEVLQRNPSPAFATMVGLRTGYGEHGMDAGVLFAGAKDAALISKFTKEEEAHDRQQGRTQGFEHGVSGFGRFPA